MSRKKKDRSAPARTARFSVLVPFFVWISVTALAFFAGYRIGSKERSPASGARSPVFERSGGAAASVALTFPEVLGNPGEEGGDGQRHPLPLKPPDPPVRRPSPALGTEPQRAGPAGTAPDPVRVQPPEPAPEASTSRVLQVASFREAAKAEALAGTLQRRGYRAFPLASTHPATGEEVHRVFVGPFPSQEEAERARNDLESGGGFHGVLVRTGVQ